jgi:hypothetical protein
MYHDELAARGFDRDKMRDEMRKARERVAELLQADTVDRAALEAALAPMVEQMRGLIDAAHGAMLDLAVKLPAEERKDLAKALSGQVLGARNQPALLVFVSLSMPQDSLIAYADQAERDHAALKAAVSAGTIAVQIEDRCTACSFWDTGLNPTPPWRRVEVASDGVPTG